MIASFLLVCNFTLASDTIKYRVHLFRSLPIVHTQADQRGGAFPPRYLLEREQHLSSMDIVEPQDDIGVLISSMSNRWTWTWGSSFRFRILLTRDHDPLLTVIFVLWYWNTEPQMAHIEQAAIRLFITPCLERAYSSRGTIILGKNSFDKHRTAAVGCTDLDVTASEVFQVGHKNSGFGRDGCILPMDAE
ncbi:uncharacterized protein ARMOST_19854 [Armillaria ostoyae]|uniref:Uncharacterized protein n=1 Tax=Armillaria ostoyae TaxID=47428 RepID=A0A284S5Q5_ARMOS|nr:uncharacterized protein ARMOST_19854 [Armillaria ostoyae]